MNVVIGCFRGDRHWARTCAASVRHWHPEARIFLLKDLSRGDFSTAEMEQALGAELFPNPRGSWGWPWSKLAVFFHPQRERFLFLDSDTVLLGRLDGIYQKKEADFVVTGIRGIGPESETLNRHYLDQQLVRKLDPVYRFPGYAFNGGQMVITAGMFRQEDFASLVEFGPIPKNRYPEIFKHGDQGILNYFLAKAAAEGRARVAYEDFWIWGWDKKKMAEIGVGQLRVGGIPQIAHWAGGDKGSVFHNLVRKDILDFYEESYYRKVPAGRWKRAVRSAGLGLAARLKKTKKFLIGPSNSN
jgi:hypothetical protein